MVEYPEKRIHPRYVCEGGVEVSEGTRGFWGTLSDICAGGFYVQSFSPMAKGTELSFFIKTKGYELRGRGKVVAMHPGVGMAIHFLSLDETSEPLLNRLLAELHSSESQQGGSVIVTK